MPVIGTAGHVDHGKSTLIEALTGRDPDRWDEEKERGLTIDLGFAWTTLGDRTEVGFVDVPGHERFIKNMLAGIDAIDVALFVVAADEGWMPQSEEHLAVLDLLGISKGVIALTRADIVDTDTADLAELEVQDRVAGTVLENAPIIRTGAPAGLGVSEIRDALAEALEGIPARSGNRPRLWIDRAFTIGGAGTVVTGTLVGGPVEVGDQLVVWPGEDRVRIRTIQSHETGHERLDPGRRAALNLAGTTRDRVPRGAMLGRPADWEPTTRFLADLRAIRDLTEPLRDRGAYQLHVGSSAVPARLRLVEGPSLETTGVAAIEAQRAIPLRVGRRRDRARPGSTTPDGSHPGRHSDPAQGPRRSSRRSPGPPRSQGPGVARHPGGSLRRWRGGRRLHCRRSGLLPGCGITARRTGRRTGGRLPRLGTLPAGDAGGESRRATGTAARHSRGARHPGAASRSRRRNGTFGRLRARTRRRRHPGVAGRPPGAARRRNRSAEAK
jgi:selenocysteine-specific elongation factor